MSLLEDVFLQDEANEAQELERVIEGDEYDERPRSAASNSDDNSAKEDEAEEDKRRVDPTSVKAKRIIRNPRFVLNPARLTGPRGIEIIPEHFKDFKFKGKGHEKEDLDLVLKKLEHWAYRLYPKFGFEDCIKKIETLGKKRPVMVHLQRIRTDQLQSAETVVQKDSSDDDEEEAPPPEEDEFDKLLQQQIELSRVTPAPDSARKPSATPRHAMSPFPMPKATSSPSISDEQKERMLRNRKLAEERRLARLKQNTSNEKTEAPKLNTLHERLSNEPQHESSDEETNINLPVTVEINTSRVMENTSKEAMIDELQEKDVNEINIETANNTDIGQSGNVNNDALMNNIGQEDASKINVDNNTEGINEDVSDKIENNTKEQESMVAKEADEVTSNKEIEDDIVSTTEKVQEPEITKHVDISGVGNDTKINKMNNDHESVTTDKANDTINEVSPEKAENVQMEVGAKEKTQDQNIEMDQLVENELMDVDFDDDF